MSLVDIPVDQLQPESILASDVITADGRVIVRAPRVVDERLIQALEGHGIASVRIRAPQEVANQKARLTFLLSLNPPSEEVKQLERTILAYRLGMPL